MNFKYLNCNTCLCFFYFYFTIEDIGVTKDYYAVTFSFIFINKYLLSIDVEYFIRMCGKVTYKHFDNS